VTHLRLGGLGAGRGIRVCEHERVGRIFGGGRGGCGERADGEEGGCGDVGRGGGVAEGDAVVGGGVEEVEAEGGGEGWGEDVWDDGGLEESWGRGGGGRWRGVCWRKGRGGKGGGGRKGEVHLLGFDTGAGGGEDICERTLFEDAPDGSRGCQGGIAREE